MIALISPHKFCGTVRIPASKSHTIRQLLIASLADGTSEILHPLDSLDTRSCLEACRTFGAEIEEQYENNKLIKLIVKGGQKHRNKKKEIKIDVGNSGTTLYLALAVAALQDTPITFTGDESIQKRSAVPLLNALANFGVAVKSNNGCAPITVQGPWKGGKASLPCPTSQYLSAILIAAPLAPEGTVTKIDIPQLNEIPYIEMTLSYLKAHGIRYEAARGFSRFVISGGQTWKPFSSAVPADFSSAAFPAAAAAITGGPVTLLGLEPEDTQGDKYFLEILQKMGCDVKWEKADKGNAGDKDEWKCSVSRNMSLRPGTFDLNNTPDLLPAAAAVAAFAQGAEGGEGDTVFTNVAHARIKETDRIAVMAQELAKLGVKCTEKPDGLVVHGNGRLYIEENSVCLDGHGDHRIVMALAIAALGGQKPVEITGAEAADVTYPEFLELIGAKSV